MRVCRLVIVAAGVVALGSFSPVSASPNIVLNGSFETGDFTDWVQWGDQSYTGVDDGSFFGLTPPDGTHYAYFGPSRLGGIDQVLTTVPGQTYVLRFDLANGDTDGNNEFQVEWNSIVLTDQVNAPAFGWTEFSFSVVGTGSDTLSLGFSNPVYNFYLDDVKVVATPEPATIAMAGSGALVLLGVALYRRKKRA